MARTDLRHHLAHLLSAIINKALKITRSEIIVIN